jgi:hypothetical protein
MEGSLLTHWTARAAFLLYAGALAAWMAARPRVARQAWTAGFLVYLAHVAAAFQFYHHWSHDAAYRETARQTGELLGIASGAGLYWNYGFTAVWAADVIRLWRNGKWPRGVQAAIHCFMAFMFFNATVVFVSGWVRWMGIGVAIGLLALRLRRGRSRLDD